MNTFNELVRRLGDAGVRFVVMGVWGANYYAESSGTVFNTEDRDLFLPPDPANLLGAWSACTGLGFTLWSGQDPLDEPRDEWLARQVVRRLALTTARDPDDLRVDLSLVMAGFDFEVVWAARREFSDEGVPRPVASLLHIVQSKAAAGRPKDRLFLATHEDALKQVLGKDFPKPREPG